MGMFGGIDASASGLTAERLRMDVISNNIANANTTRTREGGAYHRRYVVFTPREERGNNFARALAARIRGLEPGDRRRQPLSIETDDTFRMAAGGVRRQSLTAGDGVRAVSIETDNTPGPLVYDPGHPDANAQGYVERPNINIVTEMVDMITASRAYEANATAISTTKSMVSKALDIGRG